MLGGPRHRDSLELGVGGVCCKRGNVGDAGGRTGDAPLDMCLWEVTEEYSQTAL